MIFTGKVDIAAPAETVFDTVTDFEALARQARRKGAVMRRLDAGTAAGPDMRWETDFRFRGKDRHMDARVTRFIRPEEMAFEARSRGFDLLVTMQVVALAATRARLHVTVEAHPRTLGARLLLQSARLGQSTLEARFQQRLEAFCAALHAPAGV
ncbi:MAG TPA: SRPBCC family protein [Paenirhodobacter sp.]